jgi:phosphonate transport system ATP-binding protein
MVALIGPSGSGKSTLLRALTGLVRIDRDEGRVEAFGQPVQARDGSAIGAPTARAHRLHLPAVQSGRPPEPVSAMWRWACWGGRLLARRSGPVAGKAEAQGVMAALHRVGVAEYAGQSASTLSGGQQQRGAIARALVQQAQAVLADEPVASLDPVSARRVMELLQRPEPRGRPDRGGHPAPGRLRPALLLAHGGAAGRQDRV